MQRKIFLNVYLVIIFLSINVFSQEVDTQNNLLLESEKYIYNDPIKSRKIANYIIHNTQDNKIKNKAILLNIKSCIVTNEFSKAIDLFSLLTNVSEEIAIEEKILIIETLYHLGLYNQLNNFLSDNNKLKDHELFKFLLNKSFKESNNLNKLLKKNKNFNVAYLIAEEYQRKNELDKAKSIYLNLFRDNKEKVYQIKVNIGFATIMNKKQNYNESITLLKKLLVENSINDVELERIHYLLGDNYLRINSEKNALNHFQLALIYSKKNKNQFQQARIKLIKFLDDNAVRKNDIFFNKLRYIVYFFLFILVLLTITFVLKRYIFPETKNNFSLREKKDTLKIPEKTKNILEERLLKFEENQLYLDNNLSLNSLAKYLQTNTSYLSDFIKNQHHKNFKGYINELRINYITKKLKNNPEYLNYKIDYLAKESGFISRTSFSVIFKSITGLSPSQYIEKLKNNEL